MKWQDKLAMMERAQATGEYAQKPTASEIRLDFMKEEMHPRLEPTSARSLYPYAFLLNFPSSIFFCFWFSALTADL